MLVCVMIAAHLTLSCCTFARAHIPKRRSDLPLFKKKNYCPIWNLSKIQNFYYNFTPQIVRLNIIFSLLVRASIWEQESRWSHRKGMETRSELLMIFNLTQQIGKFLNKFCTLYFQKKRKITYSSLDSIYRATNYPCKRKCTEM